MKAPTLVMVLVVLTVGLAGCGVSLQSEPQAIPPDVIPAPIRVPTTGPSPSPSPTPSPSASVLPTPDVLDLWFVREEGLVAVASDLPLGSPAESVMIGLASGPGDVLINLGLRTIALDPVTGLPLAVVVTADPDEAPPASGPPVDPPASGVVTVQLSSAFPALPPAEQVLLLGQVVLSLTGAGAESVAFIDESGTSLAVPLPDGRLLDVPATAADFQSLITVM